MKITSSPPNIFLAAITNTGFDFLRNILRDLNFSHEKVKYKVGGQIGRAGGPRHLRELIFSFFIALYDTWKGQRKNVIIYIPYPRMWNIYFTGGSK